MSMFFVVFVVLFFFSMFIVLNCSQNSMRASSASRLLCLGRRNAVEHCLCVRKIENDREEECCLNLFGLRPSLLSFACCLKCISHTVAAWNCLLDHTLFNIFFLLGPPCHMRSLGCVCVGCSKSPSGCLSILALLSKTNANQSALLISNLYRPVHGLGCVTLPLPPFLPLLNQH